MEKTTIEISKRLAKRLRMWKIQLDAKSIEEVIDRILKIIPASKLKNLKEAK